MKFQWETTGDKAKATRANAAYTSWALTAHSFHVPRYSTRVWVPSARHQRGAILESFSLLAGTQNFIKNALGARTMGSPSRAVFDDFAHHHFFRVFIDVGPVFLGRRSTMNEDAFNAFAFERVSSRLVGWLVGWLIGWLVG